MIISYYDKNGNYVTKETAPSNTNGIIFNLSKEDFKSNNQKRTEIDLIDISRKRGI